jgi:ribonuclease Z
MFQARLVNEPFGDPGLYIELLHRKDALLFDLGDIGALPNRSILKLRHIFVSHTHMDHFIGFDHLLRVVLGRDKDLDLYGPPGFIRNVENRIASYTWNLVENYTNRLVIRVTEFQNGESATARFSLRSAFRPEMAAREKFTGRLVEGSHYSVKSVFLDHKIPSLAFSLQERQRVNIRKNALERMGLPVGPWLTHLKDAILNNEPDDTPVQVWWRDGGVRVMGKVLPLGLLKSKVVSIAAGCKIAYVADSVFSPENAEKIVGIASAADHLFIEACFLEEDSDRARDKYHLTARQAGELARQAGVKRVTPFHFSPKYQGRGELLVTEVMEAFNGR